MQKRDHSMRWKILHKLVLRHLFSSPGRSVHGERANFAELVIGCIEADFCNQIFVGTLSPRSTKFTPLHRSPLSIFFPKFCQNFANFYRDFATFCQTFAIFWRNFAGILPWFARRKCTSVREFPGVFQEFSRSSPRFAAFGNSPQPAIPRVS